MTKKFVINGGKKLKGEISVNTSKNGAVSILIGSLINHGQTVMKNVADIEEIKRLVEVLSSMGVDVKRKGRDLIIKRPQKIEWKKIDKIAARKTRSIILAIGALAGDLKKFEIPQAGGCRLGSRTVQPHLFALENFGLDIKTKTDKYVIERKKDLFSAEFVLYETGDTVTVNALLAAAQIPGKTVIRMASANYQVQDLCFFLEKLGVKIKGIGTSTLEVFGKKKINKNIEYQLGEDPIEAMFFLSLAIVTDSSIKIKRCPIEFLELELLKLSKMGFKYKKSKKYKSKNKKTDLVDITTYPSKLKALKEKIHALPFPGVNQDNLPFFVPIATQAQGQTLIHDWTYENRAIYFSELNRLGANITLMDPHRVIIEGKTKLHSAELICPPALRPAAIILVAMFGAPGKSILRNVYPIARGYENLENRLSKLGGGIKLIEDEEI